MRPWNIWNAVVAAIGAALVYGVTLAIIQATGRPCGTVVTITVPDTYGFTGRPPSCTNIVVRP